MAASRKAVSTASPTVVAASLGWRSGRDRRFRRKGRGLLALDVVDEPFADLPPQCGELLPVGGRHHHHHPEDLQGGVLDVELASLTVPVRRGGEDPGELGPDIFDGDVPVDAEVDLADRRRALVGPVPERVVVK